MVLACSLHTWLIIVGGEPSLIVHTALVIGNNTPTLPPRCIPLPALLSIIVWRGCRVPESARTIYHIYHITMKLT